LFDVFDPDGHAYAVGDVAAFDGVLYPGEVSDADAARLAAAT
jgi:hypothetical protein